MDFMNEDRKERFKIKRSSDVAPEDDQLGENKYEAFDDSNRPAGDRDRKR
jgi:hypothetical protein